MQPARSALRAIPILLLAALAIPPAARAGARDASRDMVERLRSAAGVTGADDGRAAPTGATAAAQCLDFLDPNETCSASQPLLVPDGYVGLLLQSESDGDRDWYRIAVGRNETIQAEVVFRETTGFSSLALYASCGGVPVVADSGSGTTRTVQYQHGGADTSFWFRVSTRDAGVCRMYDMAVSRKCPDAFDPNEFCAIATPIGAGTYPGLWSGGSITDEDFYSVRLLPQQRIVVDLDFVHAQGNLNVGLFAGCGGDLLAASLDTLDGEHFEYLNEGATADFVLLVDNATNPACTPYAMTIAINGGLSLDATVTPPGWDHPTVPRAAPDASPGSARVPARLPGNADSTWLNLYVLNDSPVPLPEWTAMMFVDGEPVGGLTVPSGNPPGPYLLQNFGPVFVRGGRHTVGTRADWYGQVAEPDTADDSNRQQFVWSPLEIERGVPVSRPAAPLAGPGPLPDCDGFRYVRDPAWAWVIASSAFGAQDCYRLIVYDDYAGSTSGFSHVAGASNVCSRATNFVVGHAGTTPVTLYPAVYAHQRFDGAGFGVDAMDSRQRIGGPSATFASQTLPEQRLADVYEAYIEAGQTVWFTLRRSSGAADLRLEVFPATPGGVFGRGGGRIALSPSPGFDLLTYTATTTGQHPVVVYRDQSADLAAVTYHLSWSALGPLAAPGPAPVATLEFAGAVPNPMAGHGRFDFVLPAPGPAGLEILDAAGRRVRSLAGGELAAGRHACAWDGRDRHGAAVGAGVYWARLEAAGRVLCRRFVVLP
jgi:hypothetical protein